METSSVKNTVKRRSGISIMGSLIGLVKPLWPLIVLAVLFGTAGYLCAIFLTIITGNILARGIAFSHLTWPLLAMAVMRGVLHYAEQYFNHFIAFKLLAIIRHDIFAALRRLCPAKLEGRDKGNLISVITSDIELLEVFYAHTISPIAIAILTEGIMVGFIGSFHPIAGLFALAAYIIIGIFIPLWNGRKSGDIGMAFRNNFGNFNSFLLDSFRGLDETLQYGQGENRKQEMEEKSIQLGNMQKSLSQMEGTQRAITNMAILLFSFGMLFLTLYLQNIGAISFTAMITCTTAMMGSFGPVVALSSLSNNLNQTLASGERVLSILEETPMVEEVSVVSVQEIQQSVKNTKLTEASANQVTFAYEERKILENFSFQIHPGKITGIHGPSGCGKSTLLKLFMRFWDTNSGEITINGQNIKTIPTKYLRDMQSYVTQETHIFHDSIAANIAIGKPGATREEIIEAAKKASLHEFIMKLPDGYDTEAGELGDTLSGGEKQRIGIARAFLHDVPFILLDEPTSNLDSLNEGIILKSLQEEKKDKTILIVSHRESTMQVADEVCYLIH
ncbi:amino acid ABC transporter ATP-binding/permease protein [Anaerobutyricum hallii]|mgnify:CR=1 FL=1|jgi:ATP-binding cassette, subfamily C, bacterial|uniref:amino acid ABC transporter ATP-binding/permease protein n=1 Tax=Anaerobutyricum hallii TaxID=39488 RepID=UPI003A8414E4